MDKPVEVGDYILVDGPTIEGPLEAFFQPGDTWKSDGTYNGKLTITHIDRETNTIWLESTETTKCPT